MKIGQTVRVVDKNIARYKQVGVVTKVDVGTIIGKMNEVQFSNGEKGLYGEKSLIKE